MMRLFNTVVMAVKAGHIKSLPVVRRFFEKQQVRRKARLEPMP
jgi:hypothetical protein